jgi:CubicO group peptidase (beta-lactamase class C family)
VTISNYTLFLEWGWETNRLKAGTVTVQNGGRIMHLYNTATAAPWDPNAGVFIECSNLTVAAGGMINCDSLGYGGKLGAAGYGPGYGSVDGSSVRGGGGGYGGGGGIGEFSAPGGVTYGSLTNPALPGSGGGGGYNSTGADGGGYVKVVASDRVTVNGLITACGTNALDSFSGAGSGGGISIRCRQLFGSGTIRANGGNGSFSSGSWRGGGGGGGRIAIYLLGPPYYTRQISCSATNGAGYGDGTNGTVYFDFRPRGTMFSAW